jgi:hypothetical protein
MHMRVLPDTSSDSSLARVSPCFSATRSFAAEAATSLLLMGTAAAMQVMATSADTPSCLRGSTHGQYMQAVHVERKGRYRGHYKWAQE